MSEDLDGMDRSKPAPTTRLAVAGQRGLSDPLKWLRQPPRRPTA